MSATVHDLPGHDAGGSDIEALLDELHRLRDLIPRYERVAQAAAVFVEVPDLHRHRSHATVLETLRVRLAQLERAREAAEVDGGFGPTAA